MLCLLARGRLVDAACDDPLIQVVSSICHGGCIKLLFHSRLYSFLHVIFIYPVVGFLEKLKRESRSKCISGWKSKCKLSSLQYEQQTYFVYASFAILTNGFFRRFHPHHCTKTVFHFFIWSWCSLIIYNVRHMR